MKKSLLLMLGFITLCGFVSPIVRGNVASEEEAIAVEEVAAGDMGSCLTTATASTDFALDARDTNSYSGSGQTWSDIVSANDFYLGSDGTSEASDPTFNGTPGDSAAYFSSDGSDFFSVISNSTLFNDLHKTSSGNAWWMAFYMQTPGTASFYMFDTGRAATNADGYGHLVQTNERIFTAQRGGSVTSSIAIDDGAGTFPDGVDVVMIVSFDQDSNTMDQWLNSDTATQSIAPNFQTSTTNPTDRLHIGARSDGGATIFPSGVRVYAAAGGNAYIDDTAAAAIRDCLETGS